MPKTFRLAVTIAVLGAASLVAHDMYLIVPDHDVPADTEIEIALYNGTFDESLNSIDRDRMIDVTYVDGAGSRLAPTAEQWRDEGDETRLTVASGPAGTSVLGVSTAARMIELSAEEFNEYLRHDGVVDVLEARERDGRLEESARESYAKHVKTVLRVGGETSESWSIRFGYPAELVPMVDPFSLAVGDQVELLVLANGEPLAGQLVYASSEGFHGHDDDGEHRESVQTRSDEDGVVRFIVDRDGRWYARLIHMVEGEGHVDYVSNWATLTFEVQAAAAE